MTQNRRDTARRIGGNGERIPLDAREPTVNAEELRRLSEAATPGPWEAAPAERDSYGAFIANVGDAVIACPPDALTEPGDDAADAAFIVALVNAFRAGRLVEREDA